MKVAEQQALLETLARQKAEMEPKIARLAARREADERQLAEKNAELKQAFGTDDLTAVKEILEKTSAEHERKLLACQGQMAASERQIEEMEAALAQLDGVAP